MLYESNKKNKNAVTCLLHHTFLNSNLKIKIKLQSGKKKLILFNRRLYICI